MTKIYMFGVSELEEPIAKEWAEDHNIKITMDEDILTPETVERAEGYDGVSTYQYAEAADPVYPKLKEYGIKNIAQRMAGFDPYNLEYAKENDIIITNVADYSPESIAEFVVAETLNMVRNLYKIHDRVSEWNFQEGLDIRGQRIGNMTVAIIGTGRIGAATARIFKNGFGIDIIGYDMYRNEELVEEGLLEYVDTVEEAVKQADIVSLHLPSTDETTGMFNDDLFAEFKDNSYLVNAGRGALVDTEALLRALKDGKLAGAAIDTYENEFDYTKSDWSDKDSLNDSVLEEMIERDDISYTPHIAYYTDESVRNMVRKALDSTLEVIETGDADARVN